MKQNAGGIISTRQPVAKAHGRQEHVFLAAIAKVSGGQDLHIEPKFDHIP
jgi:hypothetical protein